jgi:hypothetical protein
MGTGWKYAIRQRSFEHFLKGILPAPSDPSPVWDSPALEESLMKHLQQPISRVKQRRFQVEVDENFRRGVGGEIRCTRVGMWACPDGVLELSGHGPIGRVGCRGGFVHRVESCCVDPQATRKFCVGSMIDSVCVSSVSVIIYLF